MSGWSRATVGGSGNQAKGANIVQEQRPPSRIMEKRGIGGKRIAKNQILMGFPFLTRLSTKYWCPKAYFLFFPGKKLSKRPEVFLVWLWAKMLLCAITNFLKLKYDWEN
jgi:hypothetical protein